MSPRSKIISICWSYRSLDPAGSIGRDKGSLNVQSIVGSVQLDFSSVEFTKCSVQCAVGNEVCSVGSI